MAPTLGGSAEERLDKLEDDMAQIHGAPAKLHKVTRAALQSRCVHGDRESIDSDDTATVSSLSLGPGLKRKTSPAGSLGMLNIKFPKFDGENVGQHWALMNVFKKHIQRNTELTPQNKLTVLLSSCSRAAKRLIEGCMMTPAEESLTATLLVLD